MPFDDLPGGDSAETYPALDALLDPNQIDISEPVGHDVSVFLPTSPFR
jgi:hypothetical protein